MAHYVLPLPALLGALAEPARSRWMGGLVLLLPVAKAVMGWATGGLVGG
jgi:hypothetical protein